MMIQRIPLFFLLFSLLWLSLSTLSCRTHNSNKERAATKTRSLDLKLAGDDDSGVDTIKIFNNHGANILKLKEKPYGFKLYALLGEPPTARALARLIFEGANLRIDDAEGNDLYKLSLKDNRIRVEDDGNQLLYSLQPRERDFTLENGKGELLYLLKPEESGYKVIDGKDRLISRIKRNGGHIDLESSNGEIIMEVRGLDNPLAISAFALEQLNERERAALMILLNRKGRSWQ